MRGAGGEPTLPAARLAATPAAVWHSRVLARAASGPPLHEARLRTAAHSFSSRRSTPSTSGARTHGAHDRCVRKGCGGRAARRGGGGGGTHLGEVSLEATGEHVTTAQRAPLTSASRWSSGGPGCESVKVRQRVCALPPLPPSSVSACACACTACTACPCASISPALSCTAISASNSQPAGSS